MTDRSLRPTPHARSDTAAPLRRGNMLAAVSVGMGVLMCIPGLGLIGGIVGGFAWRRSKNPDIGGRRAAVLGIVLGVVATTWQLALGAGVAETALRTRRVKPIVASTGQVIQLLGNGNLAAVKGLSTDRLTDDRLQIAADHLADLGDITAVNTWYGGEERDQRNTVIVEASLLSASHHEALVATWVRANDKWKLNDLAYKPLPVDPTTRPAQKPR